MKTRVVRLLTSSALVALAASVSNAATITANAPDVQERVFVDIKGLFTSGDKKTFENAIGTHAYNANTKLADVPQNAVLGAYLNKLGLSYDAITWITEQGANDINWLTPEAAKDHGIVADPVSYLPQPIQQTQIVDNDPPPPPIPPKVPRGIPVDPNLPPDQVPPAPFLPEFPPQVAPSAPAVNQQGCAATTDLLNMRTGPGTNYPVINQLWPGTIVSVLDGYVNNWQHISFHGGDGWVYASYIQPIQCQLP
jgi:hypothetical protein